MKRELKGSTWQALRDGQNVGISWRENWKWEEYQASCQVKYKDANLMKRELKVNCMHNMIQHRLESHEERIERLHTTSIYQRSSSSRISWRENWKRALSESSPHLCESHEERIERVTYTGEELYLWLENLMKRELKVKLGDRVRCSELYLESHEERIESSLFSHSTSPLTVMYFRISWRENWKIVLLVTYPL